MVSSVREASRGVNASVSRFPFPVSRSVSLPRTRLLELTELPPNRFRLWSEGGIDVRAERQVVSIRSDRLLALAGERGETALFPKLRREIGVVLHPRIRASARGGQRAARVAHFLE